MNKSALQYMIEKLKDKFVLKTEVQNMALVLEEDELRLKNNEGVVIDSLTKAELKTFLDIQ